MNSNEFDSADDWGQGDAFLSDIFPDDLLSNVDNLDPQSDLLDTIFMGSGDPFAVGQKMQDEQPLFSSAASDSGLSSENLDLDLHNDFGYLTSRSTSEEPMTPKTVTNKKSPNSKRARSAAKSNAKLATIAAQNNKIKKNSRSIIVPMASQNRKEFQSIKIVNSGSSQIKSANIKAAAANLLRKSKQGLVQKNTRIAVDDTDDYDELNFDDIMKETDDMLAENDSDDDDDDEEDLSSSTDCNGAYPRLVLSNEEKRLLNKEGIKLPEFHPLTKHEERELKRIRRKIRNKISAQDSRKRKKEYIDGLEERVKQCTDENGTLLKRIKMLQNQNHDLMSKMKKLQMLLNKAGSNKTAQPATCLMILILSLSLVALPNLKLSKDLLKGNDLSFIDQQSRRSLLFDLESLKESMDIDDMSYIPNDHDYTDREKSQLIFDAPEVSPYAKNKDELVDYDIDPIEEIKWSLKKNEKLLHMLNSNMMGGGGRGGGGSDEGENSTSSQNLSSIIEELSDIIQLPSQIIQESSKA